MKNMWQGPSANSTTFSWTATDTGVPTCACHRTEHCMLHEWLPYDRVNSQVIVMGPGKTNFCFVVLFKEIWL